MATLEARVAAFLAALGPDIKSLVTDLATRATKAYGGREAVAIPSTSAGVLTINVAVGSVQVAASITANITSWAWQNLPVGESCTITLYLPMGGTLRTISTAIGGTVHWLSPVPVHVINKYTVYTLMTMDAGTNWFVSAAVEA